MRLLVFGARGDLGKALVTRAAVRGWAVQPVTRQQVDVTDHRAVFTTVAKAGADAVVNCTAFHQVEACEADPLRADRVNRAAVETLARACSEWGSRLVHVSTDYVFDGLSGCHYTEEDEPNPLSVYGLTKYLGEREIAHVKIDEGLQYMIVRTSGLFGGQGVSQKGPDFVRRILTQGLEGAPLSVVDDLRFCPTYVPALAEAMLGLIAREAHWIYHLAGGGVTSWAQLAQDTLDVAGIRRTVQRTKFADQPGTRAKRPAYSALTSKRYHGGPDLGPHLHDLERYVKDLLPRLAKKQSGGGREET